MFFALLQRLKNTPTNRGFSLVELLITAGIIVLVTGSVITRNSNFTETTLLKSQALEVALDVRAAQQFGVNSRAESGSDNSAFGMYFDAENPDGYWLFRDADDNQLYDSGEEVGQRYLLDPRFEIREVCADTSCSDRRKASVAFRRPNFDGMLGHTNATGGSYNLYNPSTIQVVISPLTDPSVERRVIIYQTGQISVPQ